MDIDETNSKSTVKQEKREIIFLVLIFTAVSTFFTLLFLNTVFEQIIGLATAICIGFFILWWCKVDSSERDFELKFGFRLLIVMFGGLALIFYLFKTRGFKNGFLALSNLLLIFIGMLFVNILVTAIYAISIGLEK